MKKVFAASLLFGALSPVFAESLTFNGTVGTTTCTLTSSTIALQNVQLASLASAGNQAVGKNFNVDLSNCGSTSIPVRLEFTDATNVDATSGRLNNTATGTTANPAATNVQIALRASQTETTNMKLGTPSAVSATVQTKIDGTASIPMAAVYYATGAATAGPVSSSTQVTIGYP